MRDAFTAGMKECTLTIGNDGRATLSADNGSTKVTRDITNTEMNKIQIMKARKSA